jgi:hypothetical protein
MLCQTPIARSYWAHLTHIGGGNCECHFYKEQSAINLPAQLKKLRSESNNLMAAAWKFIRIQKLLSIERRDGLKGCPENYNGMRSSRKWSLLSNSRKSRCSGPITLVSEPSVPPKPESASSTTYDPCGDNPFEPERVFKDLAFMGGFAVGVGLLGGLWLAKCWRGLDRGERERSSSSGLCRGVIKDFLTN